MIPITLDPSRLCLGVAGGGPAAIRRLRLLQAAGADPLILPAEPAPLPSLDLLWIAGLAPEAATRLAVAAHARGILVNVEDRPELCDFRNTAELRRGDLLVAVSTGGQSPGLAGAIRDRIAALFGPEWTARVAALGARRRIWRTEGRSLTDLARLTAATIAESRWLA